MSRGADESFVCTYQGCEYNDFSAQCKFQHVRRNKVVQPKQFEPHYEEAIGHPSGHLDRIRYLGGCGRGSTRDQYLELHSLWDRNQYWYMVYGGMIIQHNDQTTSYLSSTEPNWSSVDVDAPYTWCKECSGVCTCKMENGEGDRN